MIANMNEYLKVPTYEIFKEISSSKPKKPSSGGGGTITALLPIKHFMIMTTSGLLKLM